MAHQVGRKMGEFAGDSAEMRNSDCANNEIGLEHLAVIQFQHEAVALPVEGYDLPLLEVGNELLLEVQRVTIEDLQTHRNVSGVVGNPLLCAIRCERSLAIRCAEVRCKTGRLQQHPDRHVSTPAI